MMKFFSSHRKTLFAALGILCLRISTGISLPRVAGRMEKSYILWTHAAVGNMSLARFHMKISLEFPLRFDAKVYQKGKESMLSDKGYSER